MNKNIPDNPLEAIIFYSKAITNGKSPVLGAIIYVFYDYLSSLAKETISERTKVLSPDEKLALEIDLNTLMKKDVIRNDLMLPVLSLDEVMGNSNHPIKLFSEKDQLLYEGYLFKNKLLPKAYLELKELGSASIFASKVGLENNLPIAIMMGKEIEKEAHKFNMTSALYEEYPKLKIFTELETLAKKMRTTNTKFGSHSQFREVYKTCKNFVDKY